MKNYDMYHAILDVTLVAIAVVVTIAVINYCDTPEPPARQPAPTISLDDVYPKMGQDE
jgi:hypothetical protein